MNLRRPTIAEIAFQVVLGLALALFMFDHMEALDATACSAPAPERKPNCYPWGMTEGPLEGGTWGYASKENYLRQSLVLNAAIAAAMVAPFFAARPATGLGALLFIALVGFCFGMDRHAAVMKCKIE